MDACTNPDILRVIWFFMMILDIIKIIIPIGLIVLGIVDFSKAMITSDENTQKKSGKLFTKRLIYAVLVFTVPWLIKVFMITLGNLLGEEDEVNFTDCLENANGEYLQKLENCSGTIFKIRYYEDNGIDLIESVAACTGEEMERKKYYKFGYIFKGWKHRYGSDAATNFVDDDKPLVINEAILTAVTAVHGGFNMVPVLEKITAENCPSTTFDINYYEEDGVTLVDTQKVCAEEAIKFKTRNRLGYNFKGWAFRDDERKNVFFEDKYSVFNLKSMYDNYINEFGGFNLVPVFERITMENCTNNILEIHYYEEDGTTFIGTQEVCIDEFIKFKSLSKEGYTFKGWAFRDDENKNVIFEDKYNEGYNLKSIYNTLVDNYGGFYLVAVWE